MSKEECNKIILKASEEIREKQIKPRIVAACFMEWSIRTAEASCTSPQKILRELFEYYLSKKENIHE